MEKVIKKNKSLKNRSPVNFSKKKWLFWLFLEIFKKIQKYNKKKGIFSFFWKKNVFFQLFFTFFGNFQKKWKVSKKNVFFKKSCKKSKKSLKKSVASELFSKSFELSDKLSIFCFIKAILWILRRALGAVNCFDIFVLKRLKGIGPNGGPLRALSIYEWNWSVVLQVLSLQNNKKHIFQSKRQFPVQCFFLRVFKFTKWKTHFEGLFSFR